MIRAAVARYGRWWRAQRIPGGRIDVHFADDEAQLMAGDALGMPVTDQDLPSLQIPTDGSVATLRRVLRDLDEAGVDVVDLAIRTPDLDDVFFALTGRISTTADPPSRHHPVNPAGAAVVPDAG